MAGQCIDKLSHKCGTKGGLQVFLQDDGSVDGFCYSCGTFVEHPYGEPMTKDSANLPKPKTEAEIKEEVAEVSGYPVVAMNERKLSEEAFKSYNVHFSMSERDGTTPTAVYFPYTKNGKLVGWKVKTIGLKKNKFWTIGNVRDVDLFGWRQAIASGAKRLIITEGEYDAIAMSRIIDRFTKDDFKEMMPAVVSIPHGAASAHKDLARLAHDIKKHFNEENIIFCFDMDEPGQAALEACMLVFPLATAASLPEKDANDCLIKGHARAAFNAITFKSATPKNTRIVMGEDLHEKAREPAKYGELTWPWDHINKVTRGIRYGETHYIGAGVKMGKSEFLNELATHFIVNHGIKVFMAKPEEANSKTYKLLAGKVEGKVFHDPQREFDYEAFDRAGTVLHGKVSMINLYQHLGWETLKADIITAINWGAKAIFIDPITNLTNGIDAGDANTKLQEIAQELSAIAMNHNVAVFIFCHLKAPEGQIAKEKREKLYHDGKYIGLGNCAHEMGGDIYSTQFAGSRSMMRSCNYMIGLEGNKDSELDDNIRNVRHLKILEDREFGETGVFPLWWNRDTTRFKQA